MHSANVAAALDYIRSIAETLGIMLLAWISAQLKQHKDEFRQKHAELAVKADQQLNTAAQQLSAAQTQTYDIADIDKRLRTLEAGQGKIDKILSELDSTRNGKPGAGS